MLEARAPSRQRTYLALRLDAFDEAGEDEEPGAEQTQHQLPPQTTHVVQALAHVQHVLATGTHNKQIHGYKMGVSFLFFDEPAK